MKQRLLRVVAALAATSLATVALVTSATPSYAAGESYVALGDSYSSGTGTRSYIDDGTQCFRSTYAYASLTAAAKGYSLNFRACSGAVVADVTNSQLGALNSSTRYVTVSVGGNDAGFADVLTECALPAWASDCAGAVAAARTFISNTLPGRLNALYASIRTRAPGAKVVVVGYPKIFMGEDCNLLTFFSPADQSALNNAVVLINSVTSTAASAKGFTFVNPVSRFTGHAVCDSTEWINGLSNPTRESYHPNRLGHSGGYTPLVGGVLTGTSVTATRSVLVKAEDRAEQQAKLQRKYAAADRKITPKLFRPPTKARLQELAKEKGIDFDAWWAQVR
ncbi:SGNH/GDSL hydrolase family protein [Myceligenerans pegani]|uniref:SGNH/GDSL hydrolase family protein n=1 Tax=Myceligenerans pegani TaxID=2776917 RepID=A0ABR9MYH4_9MICO|nr:SGNH/GDSL hydrolase family protein [Myceligenerans sp. TRM 65318]MBE1875979.1 SGNH/GDSL hydrolase family protein [Myceligenerans sp. TRM 65318]MBE3018250.1 SGNH/GDSL hydrolase family protein [Myceligenerans sp. TRM 65318]